MDARAKVALAVLIVLACFNEILVVARKNYKHKGSEDPGARKFFSSAGNIHSPNSTIKDATLLGLTEFLNQHSAFAQHAQHSKMWSTSDYERFIEIIKPWVLADTPKPLKTLKRMDYLNSLHCDNKKFSGALTGKKLESPRLIIDFVPFGYDVDLLHIRFHETYSAVDAFIIFESTRTQSGLQKPLYFSEIRNTTRFLPYADKIIYLHANDNDLKSFLNTVLTSTSNIRQFHGGKWALEKAMRTEMIRLFQELSFEASPLKKKILGNVSNVWGLQNDGDEIVSGEVLHHLKHCEVKSTLQAVYMPCLSFKKNFHWLQTTKDMLCFVTEGMGESSNDLRNHLWRGSPYAWPLSEMLRQNSTLRYHNFTLDPCHDHMGLGAAVHMSSVAEPLAHWLKKGGVIEHTYKSVLPQSVIDSIKNGNLTASEISQAAITPWCDSSHPMVHVSTLSNDSHAIIQNSIPWVIRENPYSFPFLVPGFLDKDIEIDASVAESAKVEWIKKC